MNRLSHWTLRSMLMMLPLCLCYPVAAQQHKAHVHGMSSLLIAAEGEELVIELTAPANDIVGFEHEPKNDEQERQVDAALAILKSPTKLFGLPAAGDCEAEDVKVLAAMHDDDHDKHDHDKKDADHKDKHDDHKGHSHDHDDEKKSASKAKDDRDHDEEVHSEFRVRYHFHCHAMAKVSGIEVLMFEHFPRMHQVEVQAITKRGQISAKLDHDRRSVSF